MTAQMAVVFSAQAPQRVGCLVAAHREVLRGEGSSAL